MIIIPRRRALPKGLPFSPSHRMGVTVATRQLSLLNLQLTKAICIKIHVATKTEGTERPEGIAGASGAGGAGCLVYTHTYVGVYVY